MRCIILISVVCLQLGWSYGEPRGIGAFAYQDTSGKRYGGTYDLDDAQVYQNAGGYAPPFFQGYQNVDDFFPEYFSNFENLLRDANGRATLFRKRRALDALLPTPHLRPTRSPFLFPPLPPLKPLIPFQPLPPLKPLPPLIPFRGFSPLPPLRPLPPLIPFQPLPTLPPLRPFQPLIPFQPLPPLPPLRPFQPLIPFQPLPPLPPLRPFQPLIPFTPFPQLREIPFGQLPSEDAFPTLEPFQQFPSLEIRRTFQANLENQNLAITAAKKAYDLTSNQADFIPNFDNRFNNDFAGFGGFPGFRMRMPTMNSAFASGVAGPGLSHQIAAINPTNPLMPNVNVVNRFSEPSNPDGNYYSVSTSSFSHDSNVNGKTQSHRKAETIVNNNGMVTEYKVEE